MHGVNKRTSHKFSGDSLTLLKTLVISLLAHAAIIYLIPPVDLLPQPSPQYFEIETVPLEPEEQEILREEAQPSDQQTAQQPESSESMQEPVTPLSDYEPMTPEIASEGREPLYEQFLLPQQHFTLPETLENVNTLISSQKMAIHPEPAALDVAILSARTFSKTEPEASSHETHQIQELTNDVIVTAEQPYERSIAPGVSVVTQEILPDLKKSQMPEVFEQTNIPSLSTEPIRKRTTGSDVSAPVRPTLPNVHASPERPSLRISEAKALPQHLLAEQESPPEIDASVETRMTVISAETEPEFRPAQSVLLPTSHSQDVIETSEPVLRSVYRPAIAMEHLVLRPDPPPVYVRSEETLLDNKTFPAMTPDQVVQRAEGMERPISPAPEPSETRSELQDNVLPQITQTVRTQANSASEYIHSSAQLAKSPYQVEMPAENMRPKLVDIRQDKLLVQEDNPLHKMLPSFQTFSSLPAIARQPRQPERALPAVEQDVSEIIPRPEVPEVALFDDPSPLSAPAVTAFPRSSQALRPQNVPASIAFHPFISSEKTMTTIEETFRVKKMAEDTQQSGMKLAQQPQKTVQRAGEQESETLRKPQQFMSRPESTRPAISRQSPVFNPAQRSLVVGAATISSILPAKPTSFGIFVKKDRPIPDAGSPQSTIHMNDSIQEIKTDVPEEADSSTIEGPASSRQVISQPLRLPDIDLDVEVTIRLKFWVLPDGTVGEVIPLQRGDIRLERAAIQYLKSWRFTPLSSGNQTVWGIIPITYKLR